MGRERFIRRKKQCRWVVVPLTVCQTWEIALADCVGMCGSSFKVERASAQQYT